VDSANRMSLGGGGHTYEDCEKGCDTRKDNCNYFGFSNSEKYCHMFKTCNGHTESSKWERYRKVCNNSETGFFFFSLKFVSLVFDVKVFVRTGGVLSFWYDRTRILVRKSEINFFWYATYHIFSAVYGTEGTTVPDILYGIRRYQIVFNFSLCIKINEKIFRRSAPELVQSS